MKPVFSFQPYQGSDFKAVITKCIVKMRMDFFEISKYGSRCPLTMSFINPTGCIERGLHECDTEVIYVGVVETSVTALLVKVVRTKAFATGNSSTLFCFFPFSFFLFISISFIMTLI